METSHEVLRIATHPRLSPSCAGAAAVGDEWLLLAAERGERPSRV